MGYYIQTPGRFQKAAYLVANHGAKLCSGPPRWSDEVAIVCVVANSDFEAAAYCYSPAELEAFQSPNDPRSKLWLVMHKEDAQSLSNFTK